MALPAKRKRHDEELLAQCVARVLAGETATAVSKETDIPYTTLLNRVNWKKTGYEPASKRRQQQQQQQGQTVTPADGSDATSATYATASRQAAQSMAEVDEAEILLVMARMQRAGVRVRRRDVLTKANEMKGLEGAECGIQWFQRFRERHPEVSGAGINLELDESTVLQLLGPLDDSVENSEQDEKEEQVVLTPSQRAVQELQSCYAGQLHADDMVDAFDIMADPVVARVFLVIAPGHLRDLWLKSRIEKIQDDESGAETGTSSAV
ncbi:uncharacterized protein IUM83_10538 [Phytophthora cinnamomi]|uniref:uncharacterized protein n=1 Tax=Phytophthora cinnamomi TaxID=4785 RepID=UPI00355A6C9F|nr:hypothetical protein IUM83_10538 [Phytophthora cinnamomi]